MPFKIEPRKRIAGEALLHPASAAALKVRMDRLVPIWIAYVELTAVNG